MSTLDQPSAPGTPGSDPHAAPPLVPTVTLPVLVCLPTVPDAPPTDRAALAMMISLLVAGGPADARYRVGGRYAGLLRHLPDLDGYGADVVRSEGCPAPPVCDGGTLGWLWNPPATHTPDGELVRVVTPDGRWHGPLPWEIDSTAEIRAADPPPVTQLRRMRWWTVVVMVEVTAPLRAGEATVPPWEW